MLPNVSAPRARPDGVTRDPDTPLLEHWSEVTPTTEPPPRPRVTPRVAAALRDLIAWAADLAIQLTHGCPEDRDAIEGVRDYADAWLVGQRRRVPALTDVLTSVATLLSGIDLELRRAALDATERAALDAASVP
jgi:hypothetical protein